MCFSKMSCNKTLRPKWRVFIGLACLYLSACSVNKPIEDDSLAQAQNIEKQQLAQQGEQDRQAFQDALQMMQAADAKDADLLVAQAVFDGLYQSNPDYLGALVNSADISYRLQQYEQAEAAYAKVLTQLENTVDIQTQAKVFRVHSLNQLALLAREKGQFEQAETLYLQALAIEPSNPTVIRNLAILLDLYRGKLAEALALYEQYQSLQEEPDAKVKDWIFDLKNRMPEESSDE